MSTPLRETLDRLLALQKIDSEIDRATRAKAHLDNGSGHEERAGAAAQIAKKGATQLAELSGAQKDAELEQAGIEAKLKSYEQKMASGQLTNAREISSIEREIHQLQRQRAALDDKILTFMERVEAAKTESANLDAQSVQAEQETATQKQAFRANFDRLTAELTQLAEQRIAAEAEVGDVVLLKRYESLRARPHAHGVAIARIEDRHCSGCHNQVAIQDEEHVREALQVVTCESCGRMLA